MVGAGCGQVRPDQALEGREVVALDEKRSDADDRKRRADDVKNPDVHGHVVAAILLLLLRFFVSRQSVHCLEVKEEDAADDEREAVAAVMMMVVVVFGSVLGSMEEKFRRSNERSYWSIFVRIFADLKPTKGPCIWNLERRPLHSQDPMIENYLSTTSRWRQVYWL